MMHQNHPKPQFTQIRAGDDDDGRPKICARAYLLATGRLMLRLRTEYPIGIMACVVPARIP
jgi:hypothetical protein